MGNVKIKDEIVSAPLKTIKNFSGGSQGGTNYMRAVLQHYVETSEHHISIGVTPGASQEHVASGIRRQYELINTVSRLPFDMEIVRLAKHY